jgi:hypothetical protein
MEAVVNAIIEQIPADQMPFLVHLKHLKTTMSYTAPENRWSVHGGALADLLHDYLYEQDTEWKQKIIAIIQHQVCVFGE